ncbi:entericidin A/B family lipoprotein [Pusillimonas noertemannii]
MAATLGRILMKTRVWMPILLAIAALTGACTNTLHGAGEDIERGGEKIQQKTQ